MSQFWQFWYSLAFKDAQVIQPFSRDETDDTDNTDDADDIDYTYDTYDTDDTVDTDDTDNIDDTDNNFPLHSLLVPCYFFDRPGVAGAVIQTASWLIHRVILFLQIFIIS